MAVVHSLHVPVQKNAEHQPQSSADNGPMPQLGADRPCPYGGGKGCQSGTYRKPLEGIFPIDPHANHLVLPVWRQPIGAAQSSGPMRIYGTARRVPRQRQPICATFLSGFIGPCSAAKRRDRASERTRPRAQRSEAAELRAVVPGPLAGWSNAKWNSPLMLSKSAPMLPRPYVVIVFSNHYCRNCSELM